MMSRMSGRRVTYAYSLQSQCPESTSVAPPFRGLAQPPFASLSLSHSRSSSSTIGGAGGLAALLAPPAAPGAASS